MRYPNFVDGSNDLTGSDGQRTVNLMPEMVGAAGKSPARLIGTPGLAQVAEVAGASSGRGIFEGDLAGTKYFYAVIDATLYKIKTDGTSAVSLGSVGTDAAGSPVSHASGGPDMDTLLISNGVAYSLLGGVLAPIDALDGITCLDCCYISGYWIVITSDNVFMRSEVGDVLTWDPLHYDYPDPQVEPLVACAANNGQVWFFGQTRTTIWVLDPTMDIGLSPLQGVVLQRGCLSKSTVKIVDNAIVWLSRMPSGGAQVAMARSYSPAKISTHWVDDILEGLGSSLTGAYAIVTEESGHEVYMLSIPSASTSLAFDAATRRWHERAGYSGGTWSLHLAKCHLAKDQVHFVTARNSGKIYTLDLDHLTDAGSSIRRLRRAPYLHREGDLLSISRFRLDILKSLGAEGSAPQAYMTYSANGGTTFSTPIGCSMGETDEDPNVVSLTWHRLGTGRHYVFEVYSDAPIRHVWNDAFLN
jgi:hypothetical protein